MSSQANLQKIDELANILKNSRDTEARKSAVVALRNFSDDNDPSIREAVNKAINSLNEHNYYSSSFNSLFNSSLNPQFDFLSWGIRRSAFRSTEEEKKAQQRSAIFDWVNKPNFTENDEKPIFIHFPNREQNSGYGKLKLSADFIELLSKLAEESNSNESDIVKKGLVLVGLTSKLKQQGFRLAVVDDDGSIIANIDDI